MKQKIVKSHMIDIGKVYCLSSDLILTKGMLKSITQKGHSRVPIYYKNNPQEIIGILLMKNLVGIDENCTIESSGIKLKEAMFVKQETTILDMLNMLQQQNKHMAFVTEGGNKKIIGIITMEDVLEAILNAEILDEDDYDRISKIMKSTPPRSRSGSKDGLQYTKKNLFKPFSISQGDDYHLMEP
mmetsp:Transcript_3499/g.3251  ORF Transcript_3499/g.3251 Transcript_3499/m.3251 type:complete len:185 (+) Transcript_3499:650-1204(+)